MLSANIHMKRYCVRSLTHSINTHSSILIISPGCKELHVEAAALQESALHTLRKHTLRCMVLHKIIILRADHNMIHYAIAFDPGVDSDYVRYFRCLLAINDAL